MVSISKLYLYWFPYTSVMVNSYNPSSSILESDVYGTPFNIADVSFVAQENLTALFVIKLLMLEFWIVVPI